MASPLSLLCDHQINSKSPVSTMPLHLSPHSSKDEMSKASTPPVYAVAPLPSNGDGSEIDWDEGPSSPFLSQIVDPFVGNASKPITIASPCVSPYPRKTRGESDSDDLFLPRSLKREGHVEPSFRIVEDETCTSRSSKSSASRSATASPSKSYSRSSSNKSIRDEEIKVTTHYQHESEKRGLPSREDSELVESTFMSTNEDATIDDTCFSAFSQVLKTDTTTFARVGQSPSQQSFFDQQTPRSRSTLRAPGSARTPVRRHSPSSPSSATLRRKNASIPQYQDCSDTTNLLLDFTQQFESVSASTSKQEQHQSPTRRSSTKPLAESNLLSHLRNQRSPAKPTGVNKFSTPVASKKTILNLLDFELPLAPTPRSIPSVTIRELETLKSKYSSEISSLRATLSGREAEVEALKRAVGDAERRVGEAVETGREERSKREYAEKEQETWERRGRDYDAVLKSMKHDADQADKVRVNLETSLAEAEARAKNAEERAADAEARTLVAATKVVPIEFASSNGQEGPLFTAEQVQSQIDEKINSLSSELHTIYKKKHMTKVAGLKKGFEAKNKEKTSTLEAIIELLQQRCEELESKMEATLSGVLPANLRLMAGEAAHPSQREDDLKRIEEQNVQLERQSAELSGKTEEIRVAKVEFATLMKELERERVEKGELVAAVDEMLALQADVSTVAATAAGSAVEDFKKSIGLGGLRPTGLRGPGFGAAQSRIGAPAGLNRSISGGKSRMMSNIERMGNGRVFE